MKKNIIIAMMATSLVACVGGSSGNGDPKPAPPANTVSILPLNISMHDLNNNSINYIDVYKVGSVFKYKLTFTNPNGFAVSNPLDGGMNSRAHVAVDTTWGAAHHKLNQPGIWDVTGVYDKTQNTDDCLNVTELQPNSSCSFYTIASYSFNTTNESEFSYPISYVIQQISDPSNKLTVQQCIDLWNDKYDCSNESKPGYANQFIKYRLVSTPKFFTTPAESSGSRYYGTSGDGHTGAVCDGGFGGVCAIKHVSYDKNSNSLTYTNIGTFNIFHLIDMGVPYPTFNGGSVWVLARDSSDLMELSNSNLNPAMQEFDAGGYWQNQVNVVNGLDGSFWVNTDWDFPRREVFDSGSNSMVQVKSIPNHVYGVTTDGTVITMDVNKNLMCARLSGDFNYILVPMQNFGTTKTFYNYINSATDSDIYRVIQMHNQFYGYMDWNAYDGTGESHVIPGVFFKIHADSNNCYIDTNDYTFYWHVSVYDDYVNVNSRLTSSDNSAIGF